MSKQLSRPLKRFVGRMPVAELTRLAFIYGEQDRRAMADAYPEGSTERDEANALADEMARYRKYRWGKTTLETILENANTVAVGTKDFQ